MTDQRHSIRDIDLLAYADGLLDRNPGRKAEVEAYLRQHPYEAARVRDYADQNNAIRRLYASILAEPVPERLQAALETRPRRPLGPVARAAIVASLLCAAGFMGWLIGRSGQPAPRLVQDFIEQALTTYGHPHLTAGSSTDITQQGTSQPFDWLAQQIAVQLQPPDLTPQGFTLVDRHLITANGPQTAQVTYAAPGGQRLSLFLSTRWQDEVPQFHFAENDGVTMVYWLDGPLVYALVGHLDRQEMLTVVQAVRRSIHRQPQGHRPQMAISDIPREPSTATAIATSDAPRLTPSDLPAQLKPVQRVTQTD